MRVELKITEIRFVLKLEQHVGGTVAKKTTAKLLFKLLRCRENTEKLLIFFHFLKVCKLNKLELNILLLTDDNLYHLTG